MGILIVTPRWQEAEMMQRDVDPKQVRFMTIGQGLFGHRFDHIYVQYPDAAWFGVGTKRFERREAEYNQYLRDLSCKLPGAEGVKFF